jgi:hypothetical protein
MQAVLGMALLVMGFAMGFPIGKIVGFNNGSEWAIVQAEIVAREAGMVMPVQMQGGVFRVKLRQPGDLHQRAWKFASKHFEDLAIGASCDMRLIERVKMARSSYVTQ